MKKWGYILALLVLGALLIATTACNSMTSKTQDTSSRQVKVTRGDLSSAVSGSGNIEISHEVKLAFGVGGKIARIYVREGDKVKKDATLAALETDDLELALSQAENGQRQAELAVSQAEVALSQAEVARTQAELARTQAEVSLAAAKYDLDRMEDVKEIQDKIDAAKLKQQIAEANMKAAIQAQSSDVDIRNWAQVIDGAKQEIADNQQKLADLLSKSEYATLRVTDVNIKYLQVQAAEETVRQTSQAVDLAVRNIDQAKRNIDYTKKSLSYATKAAEYAKKQLDKATLTAPFDGTIAAVTADEGDVIAPPTLSTHAVIHLIDASSMELKVDVDEIDVPNVRLGQKAIISVDALPDLQIEGRVTFISLLPSPQAGVVLYQTTIGFQPLPDSQLRAGMSASANIVLSERKNVLQVPERAIYQNNEGKSTVKVMVNGQVQERAVVTGISDGTNTEIISGLDEGETVVIETKTKTASSMSLMGQ